MFSGQCIVLSVFPSKNISHTIVKNGNKQPNNQSQTFRRKHAEKQHICIFNVNSLFLSIQTSARNTFPSSFFTLLYKKIYFNFFARIGIDNESNKMNKLKITRKTSAIELHFLIEKFLEVFVFRFLIVLIIHLYFVYCLLFTISFFFLLVKRKLMNSQRPWID